MQRIRRKVTHQTSDHARYPLTDKADYHQESPRSCGKCVSMDLAFTTMTLELMFHRSPTRWHYFSAAGAAHVSTSYWSRPRKEGVGSS